MGGKSNSWDISRNLPNESDDMLLEDTEADKICIYINRNFWLCKALLMEEFLEITHATPFVRSADLSLCFSIITEAICHLTAQCCNLRMIALQGELFCSLVIRKKFVQLQ